MKQLLESSLFCDCSKYISGAVVCFLIKNTGGKLLEQSVNIKFLVKLERNDTDVYKRYRKFMEREH
jgi:hypothetical protein